ncbi:MFS transporter [Nocardioides astragali]|uniref:MFS transporter n=1 Tax=Nocardioides astragali TaxID=1776736 RepID=A0ABW2N960_9ACTN|nr:MFS transporter [Nocardioides astragali]
MRESRDGSRLVAAALAAALMPLNSTMIAVALPEIGAEFDTDPAVVTQALVTSYLVAAIVLQSPAGKVADRVGHARTVAIGQVLVAAGAVLGYVAPSLALLTVARILMAAGGAVLVPATVALLRRTLPHELRGRGFGAFGAVMALAAALGPLAGGALVDAFGWPSVFVANLPVLAVSVGLGALAGRVATSEVRGARPRFDWVGSLLLAAALTSLVMGLRPDGGHTVALLAAGAALLVPFVLWERRAGDPVVAFYVFRSVTFSAGTVLVAVQNLVMYALLFEVPLIAKELLDLGARATGQLLVSLMLAMVIVSPVGGRLVDRVGARAVALAGSVVALVGIVALARVDLTAVGQVAVPLALLGAGLGLATPAAQSASTTAAPADDAGMAAGIGSTMRYLGGLTGVAVMSLLLDVTGTRAAVVSDHRTLMTVFAGALVIGLVCATLLPGRIAVGKPQAEDVQSGI